MANTKIPFDLDHVVKDFKRHTSKNAVLLIENEAESRRECLPALRLEAGLLDKFAYAGKIHLKNKNHKAWQDKNHAIELFTERVTSQKLNYFR